MKRIYVFLIAAFCANSFAEEPLTIPPEIVAQCKAGGGCVIVLESDLKAALLKAKAEGEKTCRKTI